MNTLAEKRSQLAQIEHAQYMLATQARSPRHRRALRQSSVCIAGGISLASAMTTWLNPYLPGIKGQPWLILGLALLAGIWSYRLALRDSTTPASWAQALDALLARYEPVNRQAFEELMHVLRTKGKVDTGQFIVWLGGERLALGRQPAPAVQSYTVKDLPAFAARASKDDNSSV